MGIKILRVLKPFMGIVPEIESPIQKVVFNEKLLYSVAALFAYLVMSQLPLYGIQSSESSDPLYWVRVVLGSNRGTLGELGVLPILTSGMVMQFMAAANVISTKDSALFCGAQKLFAIVISVTQAALLVFTGLYGNPSEIGAVRCSLLVVQIVFGSTSILLLDELLQKGYGIGSGINLFIAANVSQNIFWKIMSLSTISTYRGDEKEGALIALIQLLTTRNDKIRALKDAFYREDLTNFMSVVATILSFAAVIYLQGFRVELPLKHTRVRGQSTQYPIKLFYTSAMPLMLQTAIFANIYLISQTLFAYFGNNILVRILGVWEPLRESNQLVPTSGVVYYLFAPRSISEAILSPVRSSLYLVITTLTCIYLSKVWSEISSSTSRDVAKELKDQQLSIAGFREASINKELNRIIPSSILYGAACLSISSFVFDAFGAIGSGAGIFMSVMIVYQYFEFFVREQMENGGSMGSMMGGQ